MIWFAPSNTSVMSWLASAMQPTSFCVLMRLANSNPCGTAELVSNPPNRKCTSVFGYEYNASGDEMLSWSHNVSFVRDFLIALRVPVR